MSPDVFERVEDPAQLKAIALELYRQKQALEGELDTTKGELDTTKAEKVALEDEVQVLLRRISELTQKLAAAEGRDRQLALELELQRVQQQLNALNQDKYGTRSERRPRGERDEKKKKREKKTGHGPTPQPNLPIEEKHHTLDEADTCCPECGGELKDWEGKTESSDEITVVRRTFKVLRHHRHKYRCDCCRHVETALGPTRLIPGGRYSVEFAVEVAVEKYADHQPLERQVQRMKREGLVVTSQTLWDQLHALYLLALPTYLALHDHILTQDVVHADETTWRLMDGGGSKKWWVWAVCVAQAICYILLPSRGAEAARRVLKNYAGIVMADGYAAYAKLAGERDRVGGVQMVLSPDGELVEQPTPNYQLALCWMHARRPLFKAEKAGSSTAGEGLDLIAGLYAVEGQAKDQAKGDPVALLELREELRASKSRALVEDLYRWKGEQTRVLPKSHLGKGLNFLENHREALTLFLEDPRVELDNGEAERGMRGPVLGRKNHYGSRSETGTLVAAVFYSLIETCKRLAVDPRAYLSELATRAQAEPGVVFLPAEYARLIGK